MRARLKASREGQEKTAPDEGSGTVSGEGHKARIGLCTQPGISSFCPTLILLGLEIVSRLASKIRL